MCLTNCSRRRLAGLAGLLAPATVVAPSFPVLAESSDIRLDGGQLKLKRGADGKLIRPGERIVVGDGGAVLRSRSRLFCLDTGTDAEFDTDSNGRISTISVVRGGILLNTSCHNAVILPPGGGTQPAPYDAPLDHYDDDIAALEARAGRTPRWQLPAAR